MISVTAKPLTVALVGIGGYGDYYLRALLDESVQQQHGLQLVGAVEPFPDRAIHAGELAARNVPVVARVDDLYEDDAAPDLVVLVSPIAFHAEQTIRALEMGSNVLCEKPLCATVGQARQMIDARDRANRIVGIGYQWSFSDAIQNFKRDVIAGRFGRPVRLSTLVLWPRDRRYYSRNGWVGRTHDPRSGAPVFDSPVNNACAHFLHNMLYVLGTRVDTSATPQRVTAELYRANAIENYDTAAIRCTTVQGAELLFFVSHATQSSAGPILTYEFEHATVRCAGDGPLVAHLRDGTTIDYGTPASSVDLTKLWSTARAVRDGTPIECGIEASMAQTQVMCAAQRSPAAIIEFPAASIRQTGAGDATRNFVPGLGGTLQECFQRNMLPSELDVAWAVAAHSVGIDDC